MLLISFTYKDWPELGWTFSPVTFKRVNLFVGETGSGKSRMINSICNIADIVLGTKVGGPGSWDIKFRIADKTYRWQFQGQLADAETEIVKDRLTVINENEIEHEIYSRDSNSFEFNSVKLPKLPRNSCGIYLLKDEEAITPVYREFGKIRRRRFFANDLQESCAVGNLPNELHAQSRKKKFMDFAGVIWGLPLGIRLFLLKEHDLEKFKDVMDQYKAVFPTVENIDFKDGAKLIRNQVEGRVPVLTVKERLVSQPVMLHDLSSGMQKVLLILSDVIMLAQGSVYIIDEYENSLGVNAINFLPGFLNDFGSDSQFIVASHHPYLINKMPVANWQVFHRSGSNVTIESGECIKERYGGSKQEAFIQLINDPIFSGIGA